MRSRGAIVTAWLTLVAASAIAGVTSYAHALVVVLAADGHPWWAYPQPALTDLVIIGASAAILDHFRRGHSWPPLLPLLSLLAAIGMTMTFNVAVTDPHSIPPWLVNGWTAVAFMGALESVLGIVRRGRGEPEPDQATPPPLDLDAALRAAVPYLSKRQMAEAFECSRPRVDKTLPPEPRVAAAGMNGSGPDE